MKVAQLIRALSKLPPNAEVFAPIGWAAYAPAKPKKLRLSARDAEGLRQWSAKGESCLVIEGAMPRRPKTHRGDAA